MDEFILENQLNLENEIIFFGGSFNPIHNGHLEIIKKTPTNIPLIIYPDKNPFKSEFASFDLNKFEQKILEIRKDNIYFFYGFIQDNQIQKNYTSLWIGKLKKIYSNLDISLIMGFDSLNQITKWHNSTVLINDLSKIYFLSREENKQNRNQIIEKLQKINPKLIVNYLGNHEFEHVSSSIKRKMDSSKN